MSRWLGPAEELGQVGRIVESGPGCTIYTIRAHDDLDGIAGDSFLDVRYGWRFDVAAGERPATVKALGFQLAEFGLPVRADADLQRWRPLLPHRPASVLPLLLVDEDGTAVLLAPLEGVHEQVLAVDDAAGGLRWGWHGDLDSVPRLFESSLAVVEAASPRAAIDRWVELLRLDASVERPTDAVTTRLSYWTDNGAAYWYRTEPGHDVTSGIAATVADLRERGVAVGSVQVDSWWYPHEVLRPFDTDEWVVPPTGLVSWTPRPDVLPDGLGPLRDAVDVPLTAHIRHLSSASPLVDEYECWVDGDRAHPTGPDLYERWLDFAVANGIETFEHDWLVECFLGVRGLRAGAGRPAAWLEGIDRAAAERGRTLQWCMASPADLITAARLPRVTSIRTSGDHGYLVGPAFLWGWFLLVNALARPLGLAPFKDVFHAGAEHAGLEALLSSLSTGPVGLGDALGRADATAVAPCARADGVLVQPDVPIAAADRNFRLWPSDRSRLLLAECHTDHAGAGRWTYALAIHADDHGAGPHRATVDLAEVGIGGDVVLWDWRAGRVVERWDVDLAANDWSYVVAAPILDGDVAVLGDVERHATAGRQRVTSVSPTAVDLAGAPGEVVTIAGRSATGGEWRRTATIGPDGRATLPLR